jgi:23S rRNA (adenine2503-C2)-methyltransferase
MGCAFCMTAQQKVERNLTAGEIALQVLAMPERDKITNVVLMGMGEPFDNYEPVMESLEIMTDVQALELGPRKITVSTSGLVPKIEKFLKDTRVRLAISLNAPNDEIRSKLMPVNRAYPIASIMETIKKHARETKAKDFYITFEYILMKGVNDSEEHARQLCKTLHGVPCKVNLLLYNENPSLPFLRPSMEDVEKFRAVLGKKGFLNFIRTSRGRDIAAACGQLASETVRERVISKSTAPQESRASH